MVGEVRTKPLNLRRFNVPMIDLDEDELLSDIQSA